MQTQDKQLRWDKIFMGFAESIAQQSYDEKYKVGCVVVNTTFGNVAGLGYNGRGRGRPNTRVSMEQGKSGFVHAEMNAIAKVSWQGGCSYTLYTTLAPCMVCAGLILNSPIDRVVVGQPYDGDQQGIKELKLGLGKVTVRLDDLYMEVFD